MIDGEQIENVKSLGIRHKRKVEEALERLEELEEHGVINPYHKGLDPQTALKEIDSQDKEIDIHTVRETVRLKSKLKGFKNPERVRSWIHRQQG